MIDWQQIPAPFLQGTRCIAYRDPAAHLHNGVFRVFHTICERDAGGACWWYLGVTTSRDLVHWSEPHRLTEPDRSCNWSSPGNVIRYAGEWLLCLQTYPTPKGERTATADARIFVMRSTDLETWSEPELLPVKGPDVRREDMGRMIDPYLVADKDVPGRWWCFYKQNGASMSWTDDFRRWTPAGSVDAGENACVLVEGGEFVLIHSPRNGIGMKRSADLRTWRDCGITTLGQPGWDWAAGRITAGHVLDLRNEPGIERYVMFFHGSSADGTAEMETHGHASLGIAWSIDLVTWEWPGGQVTIDGH